MNKESIFCSKFKQFATNAKYGAILAIYPNYMPRLIHRKCGKNIFKILLLPTIFCVLMSCASQPPKEMDNLCKIFKEKRHWYKAAKHAEKKWGAPIQVPMAMMYQESSFVSNAKPPKNYILGVIPWGRKSSAFGYSQAKTGTWDDYVRETGNRWANRDNFSDAIDFMGWFIYKTHKVNKVSKWDAHAQYLNYHEGWGGYRRGTYKKKTWLVSVAAKVNSRASRYGAQYNSCKKKLDAGWLRRLFS